MNLRFYDGAFDSKLLPIEQVLRNRKLEEMYIKDYVDQTYDNYENDFDKLENVQEGIECIERHIKNGSKIYIIVDCDVDGYTSAAILLLYLKRALGLEDVQLIMHNGKEHGIEMKKVPNDCQLLLVPDAASNDYSQHKELKDRGVDIVILDHHEADGGVSENAIVINNQLCDYPNKSLCAAAVVYKFIQAMDFKYGFDYADDYLDLVSLGLISDMMDMRNPETFSLIQKGLIQTYKNGFYQFLLDKQSFSMGPNLTPISVAFYITPLINACIRVGTNEEKEIVFRAFLDPEKENPSTKRGSKAGDIEIQKEQAGRYLTNAKSKQTRLRDKALENIEVMIEERGLLNNQVLFVEIEDEVDKNITGLIANQLMAKYQRPVLLLRKTDGGKTLSGSGRAYDKSELNNFREFLNESEMFNYCQGHNSAFGASIDKEKAEEFLTYSNKELESMKFDITYDIDFGIDLATQGSNRLLEVLSNLNDYIDFWGKDIDEPCIYLENVKMSNSNTSLIGKDKRTLKITTGEVTLMKFRLSEDEAEELNKYFAEDVILTVNLIGKPSKNEWAGKVTHQLMIEKYTVTSKESNVAF